MSDDSDSVVFAIDSVVGILRIARAAGVLFAARRELRATERVAVRGIRRDAHTRECISYPAGVSCGGSADLATLLALGGCPRLAEAEFGEDVADVLAHRGGGKCERACDINVRSAILGRLSGRQGSGAEFRHGVSTSRSCTWSTCRNRSVSSD